MCVPTKKHLSLSALFIYLFIGRGEVVVVVVNDVWIDDDSVFSSHCQNVNSEQNINAEKQDIAFHCGKSFYLKRLGHLTFYFLLFMC